MSKAINNFLIPNVTSIPSQNQNIENSNKLKGGESSEFKALLQDQIQETQLQHGISLSTHAAKRIHERSIDIDGQEYTKIKEAMSRLKEKGGRESLVITNKAAYIVDVGNNKIVTAIDKGSITDNVFTKIDSTIVMV